MSRERAIADQHAERAVVGACLVGALVGIEFAESVEPLVGADDFYDHRNGTVYDTLQSLRRQSRPHGAEDVVVALGERLEHAGGRDHIDDLTSLLPGTLDGVEAQARRVSELSVVRRTIATMLRLQAEAQGGCEDWGDWLDRAATAVARDSERKTDRSPVPLEKAAEDALALILGGKPPQGLATGFIDLDKYTLGMHPGALTIVAGRPAHGKTAFGLGLAMGIADNAQAPVLFCSLEMPEREIAQRALSMRSGVDGLRVRSFCLHREDMQRLTGAIERFGGTAGVWLDDEPAIHAHAIPRKLAKVERLAGRKVVAVVVDYLQLMRGEKGDGREQEISSISRSLKALAKQLDIPVIALSQLNRDFEKRGKGARPQLSDLRESGAIEQDADNVLFVYREEMMQATEENRGVAEIIIGKQRSGPTAIVKMAYRSECARFDNLQPYEASA